MNGRSKTEDPVSRLLRKNISPAQFIGYAFASILGLIIITVAVKFYSDVKSASSGEDTTIGKDYLIVQRNVKGLGNLFGENDNVFNENEITDISNQKWVKRVGKFTPAGFNVSASMDIGGRGMSTALFLESIPDEFIDNKPSGWHFDVGSKAPIPVIISKDYLALYNFGFAASRGLPQISENMLSLLPIRLSISGNGHQKWFDARIVGYSSRLNTIAVPEEFMNWANDEFGENNSEPSRLIVETYSPGDPEIANYLKTHGYELAGDKNETGRAAYFLKVVTSVVTGIGLIISILSTGILLLSVWLLLYKNRTQTERLLLLGYSPNNICLYYNKLILGINFIVFAIAIAGMFLISPIWKSPLSSLGLQTGSPLAAILAGFLICTIISVVSILSVKNSVNKSFRPKNIVK